MSDLIHSRAAHGTGLASPSVPLLRAGTVRATPAARTPPPARSGSTTTRRAPARPAAPEPAAAPAAPGRTLLGYLLLPRPKDLVKAMVVPLTFVLGALAEGVDGRQVLRALVVWAALELLIYQARYQWNDIRGFAADQSHPDSGSRGRLPGPPERGRAHVGASVAVLAGRLATVVALVVLLPALELGLMLAVVTLGVFGVAAAYERLRALGTGRTGAVPAPLTPALLSIWVAVGAGYAVRGLTGLALAVDLSGRPLLTAAAVVALWGAGTAFVTCRWTLEALPFATVTAGRVRWHSRREQAREHTTGLVRWVPTHVDPRVLAAGSATPCRGGGPARVEEADRPVDLTRWRALHGATAWTAPWNLATVAAAAAAAVCGRLLVGPSGAAETAAAAVTGAVVALAVVAGAHHRCVVAAGAFAVAAAALAATGAPRPLVAALPLLAVLLAHASFTSQCLDELGRPFSRVGPLVGRVVPGAGRPRTCR